MGSEAVWRFFEKFIQIREPRRPLPKPVLFAFTVQKKPPALNKYYNWWFVFQMWLCYLTILTSVGSLLEPVKPAKHLTPVHRSYMSHFYVYLKPFDLGCDIKKSCHCYVSNVIITLKKAQLGMHVSWDWQVRSTSSTPTRPCTVRSTLESRRRTGQMAFLSMPAGMLGFHLPSTHCGWRRGPLLWSAAPLQLNQTCSGIHGLGKAHSQYHLIWKISEVLDLSQSESTSLLMWGR